MASVFRESEYRGEVVWLGIAPAGGTLRSDAQADLNLGFQGVSGARHQGENRPACVRVRELHEAGTEIRNVRQLTILSAEEVARIKAGIGLDDLDPGLLGASIVVKGIPDFTHVPPSSRLQGTSGVTLVVDMENLPCILPGREIDAEKPGHGAAFKTSAKGQRGVTAWVERPGPLRLGDTLRLWVPAQRAWAPDGSADAG